MRAPAAGAPGHHGVGATGRGGARAPGRRARPALAGALCALLLGLGSGGGALAQPPSASGAATGTQPTKGAGSGSGSASASASGSGSESGSESGSGSGSESESGSASASPIAELLERLSGAPDDGVAALIAAIEALPLAPPPPGDPPADPGDAAMLPDALFAAARACEERLRDPARALPLYQRILEHFPDARVAIAAGRRARHLREQLGEHGGSSEEARAFSQLVADGERQPLPELLGRADALAARPWPGAAEVLLWSAELVRRRGDLAEAARRYRAVLDRFADPRPTAPASASVALAIRGLAGVALERGDWALAEKMALALPATTPADAITRDELLAKARAGRRHMGLAWLARAALLLSTLGLLVSLHQLHRGDPRAALRALLRPPVEVAYMTPVAGLLIAASFTGNQSITPAVVLICLGGLAISWLSGATLASARRAGRDSPRRTLLHLLACFAAVLSLAYLAIVGTGLLDLLISTIQLGPER